MENLEVLSLKDQGEINGGIIPPTSNSHFALTAIAAHTAVNLIRAIDKLNKFF